MPPRRVEEVFAKLMRGKIGHREEKVTLGKEEFSFFPAENPGLFSDIGKLVRDVLNLDCNSRRCVVTSVNSSGIVLTHSGLLENHDIVAAISCQLKKKGMLDIIGDLKFTTRNTISGLISITCEEFVPRMKILDSKYFIRMLRILWYPKCSTIFSAEVNLHRVNEAAGLGCVLEWSV